MKTSDVLSIFDRLKITKWSDVLLLSIFILPIYLTGWIYFLKLIDSSLWNSGVLILLVLILFYFIGLLISKYFNSNERDLKIAKTRILNYLIDRNYKIVSFERIQNNIDSKYTDDFLNKIISTYSDEFVDSKVRVNKKALKIKEQEVE